jgi:hypothetical protein
LGQISIHVKESISQCFQFFGRVFSQPDCVIQCLVYLWNYFSLYLLYRIHHIQVYRTNPKLQHAFILRVSYYYRNWKVIRVIMILTQNGPLLARFFGVLKLSILIGGGCISVTWLCSGSIYNGLTHGYISWKSYENSIEHKCYMVLLLGNQTDSNLYSA